jgi:dihydroorotate dehydrogenase electron transfer subunit
LTLPAKSHCTARILRNDSVSPTCRLLVLERPDSFPDAEPGHFVSIRVVESIRPLLRRPYSIMDLTDGELTLLVKVVGPGSALLAGKGTGDCVDLIGPLGGTTFPRPEGDSAVLVAGGTGLAPMIFAARRWRGVELHLVYGASCRDEILSGMISGSVTISHTATIDGSAGHHGTAVSLCGELVGAGSVPTSYLASCGPKGMVSGLERSVGGSFERHYTSLETVMACGVGACRGCTVPVRTPEGRAFGSICSEGTVFDAGNIIWEEWEE